MDLTSTAEYLASFMAVHLQFLPHRVCRTTAELTQIGSSFYTSSVEPRSIIIATVCELCRVVRCTSNPDKIIPTPYSYAGRTNFARVNPDDLLHSIVPLSTAS